jgi:hypothetical protein
MYNKAIIRTFVEILKVDLYKYYKKTFFDDLINKIIWVVSVVGLAAYIWPQMGITQTFGALMAISAIVSCPFWDAWGVASQFVSDLEGNQVVQYYVSLPLPARLFFVKQVTFYTLRGMAAALFIVPLSKLILLERLDLSVVHLGKFIVIFVLSNIFCATMSLLMTSLVKGMYAIDNVSMRFLFPMWFFGGSQFAWSTLYSLSPAFAYLALLNPLLYAMEGMRVAFLGQSDCLPFWACAGMLCLFSTIFGYIGTKRLIRRLDCIV